MCLQEPEQPSIPDQPPKSMGQLGSRMAFVGDGLNAKSINNCLGFGTATIRDWYSNHATNEKYYAMLSAVFNVAAAGIAWAAKENNRHIKLAAQCMIASGMTYSITHGASDYDAALWFAATSIVFGWINVWSYDLVVASQLPNLIESMLAITSLSFLVACRCDQKMWGLFLKLLQPAEWLNLPAIILNDPLAFLRFWKNLFGKTRTAAFSMVGASQEASIVVEWLSFLEPVTFIGIFLSINRNAPDYTLGWPDLQSVQGAIKLLPCLLLILASATIMTVDRDNYFKPGQWLPILDLVALCVESIGMLFIQPHEVEYKVISKQTNDSTLFRPLIEGGEELKEAPEHDNHGTCYSAVPRHDRV